MPTPPDDSRQWRSGRLSLTPTTSRPVSAQVEAAVLGSAEASSDLTAIPFSDFTPAEPPIRLDVAPAPAGVLGAPGTATDEVATLEYQPDPAENAVYLLLHEIQTADGIIYDVSLPLPPAADAEAGVLGSGAAASLRFPVRQLVDAPTATPPGESATLGGIGEALTGAVGDVIFKQVLQLLRAPVAPALQQFIAEREGPPTTYRVNPDGTPGQPLNDFQSWRSAASQGQRALLFIHGFLSSAEASLPRAWMRDFASNYDLLLAYSHPTIATGPIQNAAALLSQVPDDLRLNVDLIAHSRGGVVARSLVELQQPVEKFNVTRLLTCGTPHAGTLLGQYQRWDRLASIAMTAASWLLKATGVAAPLTFIPKLLEYLLRAGGQFFFDLPGVNALDPDSEFIKQLNAPGDPARVGNTPYAVVTSNFDPLTIEQPNFREALRKLVVQAFIDAPNDLVVNTPSMSSVDPTDLSRLANWTYKANVNHFSYFDQPDIQDFTRRFLTS